jgi:glutathione S-transferase
MGQLHEGLGALDRELPKSGWIGGALGHADIAAACAHSFTVGMIGDVADVRAYANLAAFAARAEALSAFRAAPPKDGVVAPVPV